VAEEGDDGVFRELALWLLIFKTFSLITTSDDDDEVELAVMFFSFCSRCNFSISAFCLS
jgi:hypothetical protein